MIHEKAVRYYSIIYITNIYNITNITLILFLLGDCINYKMKIIDSFADRLLYS